ncbi:uncharacterized protein UV8b_07307 [Ustilaginoidea virens]|uniref:MICOS complex subunit MIC12 n=1 Tax=Ustilaginoidea virens TaxID=1159556 RepID=A0A1B5L4R7_USTVR|nr:uncharacterized protein UV8b_07307 [Ustilaginoidea virens]QUC23066.1 hypothetical protein UV8b_07307 [Ustilaginoidea virens]GAO18489.1 hypothetical protein UVI_02041750 [Ustilaginoidea virens]
MGFATGFTGGVALTLSVAYLSVLAHQRNREHQGHSLRAQALAVQSLIDPVPPPLPPSRSQVAAAKRAEAVEVAKERWNHEVENAVRWVQRTDWHDVREGLEDRVAALWSRAFGQAAHDGAAEAVGSQLRTGASKAAAEARDAAGRIASGSRRTVESAAAEAENLEAKVQDKVLQARMAAWRDAQRAENQALRKASEAEDAVGAALHAVGDKAAEVAGKVGSAVGLSGGRAAPAAAAAAAAAGRGDVSAANAVRKALDQRFEKRGVDKRTAAEVLTQRYTPMDRRDNTVLRGL